MIREVLTVWLVFRFTGRINSRMKILKCLPLLLSLCCAYAEEVTKENVEKIRTKADQGDAVAQYNLGFYYANGFGLPEDDAEAVKWFRKAAEQGNADAQHSLGNHYYYGTGVQQDYTEAVKWFSKLADQGSRPAQIRVGECYQNGEGVQKDLVTAYMWFNLASYNGRAEDKREAIAKRMTKEQIAEGQKLSREWQEKRKKVE